MNPAHDVVKHWCLMVITARARLGENAKVVEEELGFVSFATNLSKGCLSGKYAHGLSELITGERFVLTN